jgi:hypothetical protein
MLGLLIAVGSQAPAGGATPAGGARSSAGSSVSRTANVATDWNATMLEVLATAGVPAPPGTRIGAIVQASVFDAVNGIERRYTPIHVKPAGPKTASRAAAAASAAYEALVGLFPAQKTMLDTRLAAWLAGIAGDGDEGDDSAKAIAQGVTWGKSVADQILAWRSTDGFSTVLPAYVPGTQPGDWQPTPPAFAAPLFRTLAITTPFAMTSPSQFRPAPPPALGSAQYTADFNEVEAMGSKTSTTRTPFQTQTAQFWNSDTVTAFWDRVADQLANSKHMNLSDRTLLLARLNIALADTAIAIWDAKNTYKTWRPFTAIAQAGSDGNPNTSPVTGWAPLLVTPPFQEYPSGHSGVSAAAATVLASVFGEQTAFTVTSDTLPGVTRSFTNFDDAVAQVADARVFAGIHFRTACIVAAKMGVEVADYVNKTMFLPTH